MDPKQRLNFIQLENLLNEIQLFESQQIGHGKKSKKKLLKSSFDF